MELKRNHAGNYVIFFQALVAMLGSLYFEHFGDPVANAQAGNFFPAEGGFTPCNLCRWARILMYPIVWFSFFALLRKDKKIVNGLMRVSGAGILLETFHYLMQKTDLFNIEAFCTKANPCSALQVDYFGFMTIPFLCLIAFIVIFVSCIIVKNASDDVEIEHHTF